MQKEKTADKKPARKPKMTKDTVPEDFTLLLAAVDALPVLFFGGSMILIALLFRSGLFLLGALLCFWAGAAKVIWKVIVVLRKKNVWWLFLQMRTMMPVGFGLMLLAFLLKMGTVSFSAVAAAALSFPAVIFFAAGVTGMVLMGVFGAVLDAADVRANWIEQLTNAAAQAAFFIGLCCLM